MKKILILSMLLVFMAAGHCLAGETTEIWTEMYNSGKDHQFTMPFSPYNNTTNTDYAVDVAIDTKGNIIVVGYRAGDTAHAYNGYAIKYDRRGNVLCTVELDAGTIVGPYDYSGAAGYSTDQFTSVAVDSEDNIILGASKAGNFYQHGYWQEAWLRKFSPTCAPVWTSPVEYYGPPDYCAGCSAWNNIYDIALDGNDNIYVTGTVFSGWDNVTESQWFIFKYNKDGVQDTSLKQFYNNYPDHFLNEAAFGIAVDSAGNVIAVGRKGVSGCDGCLTNNYDWHVRKYGPTGTLLWQKSFDSPNHMADYAFSVKVDGNDDVIVAGYVNNGTDNSTNANNDWLVIKYSKDDGEPLWSTPYTFDGPAHKSDSINNGLAIGRDNNIWVAGQTTDASNIGHVRIALLDGATGAELYNETWTANTTHETIYGLAFRNDALIAAGALHNGTYWDWMVTPFSTVAFGDVATDFWAVDYIRSIYFDGITTGCTQTPLNYCPANNVTRQAMAAFIIRAREGEPAADYCASGSPFVDVPAGNQFCKYIKRMKELNITLGCNPPANDNYCPTGTVTRQAMAAFIIRAVEGEPAADSCSAGSPFVDVPTDHNFCRYIKRMKELAITVGCNAPTNDQYCPTNTVNRASMGAFLGRAFLAMP